MASLCTCFWGPEFTPRAAPRGPLLRRGGDLAVRMLRDTRWLLLPAGPRAGRGPRVRSELLARSRTRACDPGAPPHPLLPNPLPPHPRLPGPSVSPLLAKFSARLTPSSHCRLQPPPREAGGPQLCSCSRASRTKPDCEAQATRKMTNPIPRLPGLWGAPECSPVAFQIFPFSQKNATASQIPGRSGPSLPPELCDPGPDSQPLSASVHSPRLLGQWSRPDQPGSSEVFCDPSHAV